MGINFIPGVGQVCDARDIAACLKKLVKKLVIENELMR